MSTNIDVLCASHGNETLGVEVHKRLMRDPIEGVRSRMAHPFAAAAGRRFFGASQIMNQYPGDRWAVDVEQVAAAHNLTWLGDNAHSGEAVVLDIHNNPDHTFFDIGSRALKATVSTAFMLGYRTGFIRPDSFNQAVPAAAALDERVYDRYDEREAARRLCEGLARLSLLDIERLEHVYGEVQPQLSLMRKYDINIVPGSYSRQALFVEDPELLRHLEGKPWQASLTMPVELDGGLRQELRIGDGQAFVESWGYNNMSLELADEYGVFGGRPRRVCLGSLLIEETHPPIDDGQWIVFPEVDS